MDTKITTTARRIARDVNASVHEVTTAYDAEGRSAGSWPTGMWHADPADKPQGIVTLPGTRKTGKPLTQRHAQDLIDAAAHADARGITHPIDRNTAIGVYFDSLHTERSRDQD